MAFEESSNPKLAICVRGLLLNEGLLNTTPIIEYFRSWNLIPHFLKKDPRVLCFFMAFDLGITIRLVDII